MKDANGESVVAVAAAVRKGKRVGSCFWANIIFNLALAVRPT